MKSSLILILTTLYSLILHVGNSGAIYRLGEEDPGRDGYYDEETPSDWVDILFILLIAIHHFEYAFKFTDYSLSHVHLKQHRLSVDDSEDEVANLNIDGNENENEKDNILDLERNKSVAEEVFENIEHVFELFTTQSDTKTTRRPIHNRVCCCISWSPRFFTWQRTYLIRTFLKFYLCISCLLAMVLYVEFFMNLFIEYLITCIVHYEDAYVLALIMVPILLFVCDILIRLAWQAVLVSWSLNCDANGDLEAMGSQVGIAALRNRIVSSKRLLYTFTNDIDPYQDEQIHENDQQTKSKSTKHATRTNSYKNFKIDEVNTHKRDGDEIELAIKNDNDTKMDVMDDTKMEEDHKQSLADKADDMLKHLEDVFNDDSDSEDELSPEQKKIKDAQEAKARQRDRKNTAIKLADKEAHRAKMGDFFMATCWRMGFFIYSMLFACLGAWSVEVEVAVNGFFWQLVMRYCVLGGIVWTMVYSICSIFVAVISRYRSWYLIHSHIPRYKLFLLVDAHDIEVNNKNWTRMKMFIMFMCIFFFILFVLISWLFINQTWSSFLHFIGIIFALYYFINLFMACKPYALVALWTDSIPPPGKNYTAHKIASNTLKDKGLLMNSLRSKKTLLQPVKSASPGPHVNKEEDVKQDTTANDIQKLRQNALADLKTKSYNKTIRTLRAEDLERRYAAFQYEYIECNPEDYKNAKLAVCCNYNYLKTKLNSFLYNYEQYWLNVYRPFDEYDIENNLSSTHILHGFQWMKGICQCKLCNRRGRKKTFGQKCYTIAKYFMDNFCNICVVVTVILFMFGLFQTSQRLSGNNEAFREKVIYETNNTAYYGICTDKFGEQDAGQSFANYDLSVLDVTVLTQLAYEADNYDLCQVINVYFNGTFELIKIHREEPFYFHIRHKHAKVDFIAIRGTDNVLEMMQDLSLFVEVGIYETLQGIVPFLNMLPISFSRQIIYYASYIEGVINADSRSQFDAPVFDYAVEYLKRIEAANCLYNSTNSFGIDDWNGPTTLYLVGHSLGGGISEIVAANLHEYITKLGLKSHMKSYGVCSPGVLLSSAKFGFGVEALDKTSSSLLPRRDIVSKVDEHGGSIQYTECDASSMTQCHMMDNVLCELFYGCPKDLAIGIKNQWFNDFCQTSQSNNKTNKAQIGKSILKISGQNSQIEDISDWDIDRILEQCDNLVYHKCNKVNTQFQNQCKNQTFTNNLCFSQQTIGLVQE